MTLSKGEAILGLAILFHTISKMAGRKAIMTIVSRSFETFQVKYGSVLQRSIELRSYPAPDKLNR